MNNNYFDASTDTAESRKANLARLGLATAAGSAVVVSSSPAHAQSATTTSITDMIADVETIVGASVGLAILALTAYMGFRILKRTSA